MFEPNLLVEVERPPYKRYSLNLDTLELPEDFRFCQLSHYDFWRNYREILRVGDVVEVRGRGCDAEFVCVKVLRDDEGGCFMALRAGYIPNEAELENA